MSCIYISIFLMSNLLFSVTADNREDNNPASILPEQYGSYKLSDKLNYTGEDLFDYINGGAEVYLSYGFIGMSGCKYQSESEQNQVTVEIYEMTHAKNAYGVFTQGWDKEEYEYGQGSLSFNDCIIFWKDRYFVVINTHKVTTESTDALRHLASLVDSSIPGKGEIPEIMGDLPKQDLVIAGYQYFHHYIWLNSYYFIADFNIINIGEQTDAVLAKYGPADDRRYLLLVEYTDPAAAKSAHGQLKEKFIPESETDGVAIQLEDKTWMTIWVKGNKLGAVFNGSTKEKTEEIYKNIINNK
jgi:hypothetical protein